MPFCDLDRPAGVDFPARTVVLSNADTRGNDGMAAIKGERTAANDRTSRRRGRDKVGFVVLVPDSSKSEKKRSPNF